MIEIKKILYSVIVVFIIVGGFFLPKYSLAYLKTNINIDPQNTSNDFILEPGKTEIFLNPGESVVKNVQITSRIKKTTRFKLSAEDFVGTNDPKQPLVLLGDTNSPFTLKDFIVPEIKEFSLEFGEKITIPVTVSVPLGAEPRGYYGALIVSNDPDPIIGEPVEDTEGKMRMISRLGLLYLLRINGEGKEAGNVESFKAIGPAQTFYSKRPAGFEIAYKNTGNVHLVPYGTITIKNIFGKVVSKLPVDAYFVLPDSTRYREVNWSEGFSLGRYTANLSLFKGFNNEFTEAKLAFWVIPWKILIPVLLGILLIVGAFWFVFTHFKLSRKDNSQV